MKGWIHELQKNIQEALVLTLVGNKTDLEELRAVPREEATAFANSLSATYFETSVILNCNIESIFIAMAVGICRTSGQPLENETDGCLLHAEDIEDTDRQVAIGYGRVESGIWQRENYAHGETKTLGWCCF